MTNQAKPRYKDKAKQRFYDALLTSAADLTSEMYHQGRPHRGAGHRAAFWDGYAGLTRTANVIPGTLSAVAFAAGKQFAKTNPGIPTEEAVWTPGVTRQGEPSQDRAVGGPKEKAPDPTAAARQKRRRDKLKKQNIKPALTYLSAEQQARLDALLKDGYAPNQEAALAKGIDDAYEARFKNKGESS